MNALADGTGEVAGALLHAAPQVAIIRQDLFGLVISALGAGTGTAGVTSLPPVIDALAGLIGGGSILNIYNLIRRYKVVMTSLEGSLVIARAQMDVVEALSSNGGLVPPAPRGTPG